MRTAGNGSRHGGNAGGCRDICAKMTTLCVKSVPHNIFHISNFATYSNRNFSRGRTLAPSIKMKTIRKLIMTATAIGLALLLSGCSVIDYHPYDTRFDGATGINARNVARIEANCAGRTSLRFVLISDTQRWYDETHACVDAINARGDVDFVVHCGDLTDFGATKEFEWMRSELERLSMPYVCLLGNHDCLGTGADVFRKMYGLPDFSFNAGDTHFLCLNTNAFEYDYSVAVPDFNFIKTDLAALPSTVRRTIVAMHAQPTSEQFNNNVSDVFQEKIKLFPGLAFCMCGHGHHTQANDLYGDGVLYYECGSAKFREYVVFTLNEDGGYSYEVVEY